MSQVKVPTNSFPGEDSSWHVDSPFLAASSHGRGRECALWCLFIDTNPIRSGPHFTTSFNLKYLFKGPVPKYSYVGGWGFNI